MRFYNEICEPYEYEKENATTGGIEIIKKLSDQINTDRSLLKLVKLYLVHQAKEAAQSDEGVVVDEDEDEHDELIADQSETDNENDAYEVLNSELQE